ncbi:hypothetical protein [Sinomonas sp. ASV322]|uniref:hypothetical protein n=1 Tax=Sinomonas sp. ASV322 TaxID=3041920 RepID=UPI0027DC144E|nr:hypothetical protein [Sinomonas sp. ASV322]MDQ4502565.1 hypothetical protein [Sinomonas sp. ASV322]
MARSFVYAYWKGRAAGGPDEGRAAGGRDDGQRGLAGDGGQELLLGPPPVSAG